MAGAVGIVVATGAITAANEVLFAPLAGASGVSFNWRIVPATALLAMGVGGLEKIAPKLAVGLAATMLITALLTRVGNAPAPFENVTSALGYNKR